MLIEILLDGCSLAEVRYSEMTRLQLAMCIGLFPLTEI